MIIKQKENLESGLKQSLQKYIFDIIGVIQSVHKELPNGMPEYIYQEALSIALNKAGISSEKEYIYHPFFKGEPLKSYLKMDMMIPRNRGNIIIECKAIDKLSSTEYHQLFSYMIGTQFPIGIIVNFHGYPHATIHKFYFDKNDDTITSF